MLKQCLTQPYHPNEVAAANPTKEQQVRLFGTKTGIL